MHRHFKSRREVLQIAAGIGAAVAFGGAAGASRRRWRERRDLFPEGVASGDPEPYSVVLWTRRPFEDRQEAHLTLEVASDPDFRRVIASARAPVVAAADWTCRVLASGLTPSTIYWYRFTDDDGSGSRVGRTVTAPRPEDGRAVRYAFVSCQSINDGAQNAYRRMIWEDERASAETRLDFVLHLGDFIYEVVQYPDETARRFDRTVFDIGRVPDARKVASFHVPTTVEGYRTIYRANLHDLDVQDARARWPFVCIGDNHEFSWQGWQSLIKYPGGATEPAQALRVAANQAWWEYIPSRVAKSSGAGLAKFDGPALNDRPITSFDQDGLGTEAGNLAAIGSLRAYRAMRFGRHLELILTDLHSYAMEDPTAADDADAFSSKDFPMLFPEGAVEVLDAGKTFGNGSPPADLDAFGKLVPNFRKDGPAFTALGRVQKGWLKRTLLESGATWKVWGATNATLDMRADPQHLPEAVGKPWPYEGYATFGGGDFSAAIAERAEIYDTVRDGKVEGFVVVSGDRHSFWGGYAAKALPPRAFEPVGIAFVTASISAVGLAESLEHGLRNHPLRGMYTTGGVSGRAAEPTINMLLKRGVRSALEYARSGDLEKARALTNEELAPHLTFVDMAGHGYSVMTVSADAVETEFVCIPRPIARHGGMDGGPLRYRAVHRAERWRSGERPRLVQTMVEGEAPLSV